MVKQATSQNKGHKTHLKLRFVEQVEMSKEGIRNWGKQIRHKIKRKVYKPRVFIEVPVEEISSKSNIAALAELHLWAGKFYMFGYSKGKTRTGVKLVCLAIITIIESTDEGNKAFVKLYAKRGIPRICRYWFWNPEK